MNEAYELAKRSMKAKARILRRLSRNCRRSRYPYTAGRATMLRVSTEEESFREVFRQREIIPGERGTLKSSKPTSKKLFHLCRGKTPEHPCQLRCSERGKCRQEQVRTETFCSVGGVCKRDRRGRDRFQSHHVQSQDGKKRPYSFFSG